MKDKYSSKVMGIPQHRYLLSKMVELVYRKERKYHDLVFYLWAGSFSCYSLAMYYLNDDFYRLVLMSSLLLVIIFLQRKLNSMYSGYTISTSVYNYLMENDEISDFHKDQLKHIYFNKASIKYSDLYSLYDFNKGKK